MKALRTLLSVSVLGIIIAFSGCSGGGGNTQPIWDQQLGLLKKTWVLKGITGAVFKDGVDSTNYWIKGANLFTLTITGTAGAGATAVNGYTSQYKPSYSVWKTTGGTWQFGDNLGNNIKTTITRDDGAQITYAVDATSLKLEFDFTGTGYQRVSNVGGHWIFNLVPKP